MDVFQSFFLGILGGAFTGVIPAAHPNTLISLITRYAPNFNGPVAAAFLISLASANTVFSALPSVFLFIPSGSGVLMLLPGHRMFLQGRGEEAIQLILASHVLAAVLSLALVPFLLVLLQIIYPLVKPFLLAILLASALNMIAAAKTRRLASLAIFTLSGILGVLLFNSNLLQDPFLPTFCGFFSLSSILFSCGEGQETSTGRSAEAKKSNITLFCPKFFLFTFLGVLLSSIADMLPGIGSPAQLAALSSPFILFSDTNFLTAVSAISSSHTLLSLVSLYSLGLARTGPMIAVRELTQGPLSWQDFLLLLSIAFTSIVSSCFLLFLFTRQLTSFFSKINPAFLNATMATLIFLLVFLSGGVPGLLVLAIATSIGTASLFAGVPKINCMGLIILPVILSLSGF